MAEISSEILTNINKYIGKLSEIGVIVSDAYVYGSYSNNTYKEESDIDLAIISDDFTGVRIVDKEKILGIYYDIDPKLSVLPIAKSDFEESFFVQKEIIEKGIKVF